MLGSLFFKNDFHQISRILPKLVKLDDIMLKFDYYNFKEL
jgi:hypothetical protein